jgi:hypothetical protein
MENKASAPCAKEFGALTGRLTRLGVHAAFRNLRQQLIRRLLLLQHLLDAFHRLFEPELHGPCAHRPAPGNLRAAK